MKLTTKKKKKNENTHIITIFNKDFVQLKHSLMVGRGGGRLHKMKSRNVLVLLPPPPLMQTNVV